MEKAQNQHYLPRCYLKNFTEIAPLPGHEPAAFIFDFKNHKKGWHKKAPSNIAHLKDYYAFVDDDGNRNNEVEQLWGLFESNWPNILKKIEDLSYEPSEEERSMIATFIASFIARVPAEIESVKAFYENAYMQNLDMIMKIYSANPELFEQTKKRIEATGFDMSGFNPSEIDVSEFSVHVPTPYAVWLNLNKLEILVSYLMQMEWLVVRPNKNGAFITAYSHRFWPARRINLAGKPHSFWPPCRI